MRGVAVVQEPGGSLTTPAEVACSPLRGSIILPCPLRTRPLGCFSRCGDGGACFVISNPLFGEGIVLADQEASSGYSCTSVSFFREVQFPNWGAKLFKSRFLVSCILRTNKRYLMCRPHCRLSNSEAPGMNPGVGAI